MGTRVELADAKADRALEQLSNLSDAYVAGLNKLSTNISDRIDQRLMALRIALQREHAASMTQPTLNDGRIINPNFVPQLPPPPAPTAVAPQPPQPYVAAGVTVPPGYSVQRDDSSELAKVERRLAQRKGPPGCEAGARARRQPKGCRGGRRQRQPSRTVASSR